MPNAALMTYLFLNFKKKYKIRNFFFEKKNNFADNYIFFIWSEESSKYSGIGLLIHFQFCSNMNKKVEDRFITFKKDMEIYHKNGSN